MHRRLPIVGLSLCAALVFIAPVRAQQPGPGAPVGSVDPVAFRQTVAGADAAPPSPPAAGPDAPALERRGGEPADRERATADAEVEGPPIVAGNPAAATVVVGTGDLGRLLGLERRGIRVAGSSVMGATVEMLGGVRPGRVAAQNLLVLAATADLEQLCGWKGATFEIEFLDHHGTPAGSLTGDVQGFEGLDGGPPLSREELYQLWLFQTFLEGRLSVRIGKLVPTYQFGSIADVTGLIMTPIFVMPTVLGREPGYPDSAAGITVVAGPSKPWYAQFGFYDGRGGVSGVPTGLHGPEFNGQYFTIGETGLVYQLGRQQLGGKLGLGGWGQIGELQRFDGGKQDGTSGFYFFAKQHLWYENSGIDQQGMTGYLQLGLADPRVQLVQRYLGAGLAWSGFIPRRDRDSVGMGVAWGRLTDEPGARNRFPQYPTGSPRANEVILQGYYQRVVSKNVILQPVLTYIIDPGSNSNIPNAFAFTQHLGLLF
jgi:porin